ncbi:hypothetical protein [Maribellus sediminis]|uniref:hypothetical protein n=1 Tax=Maribellus sediminis TaxID=2696285 RepID=UPI001431499F|nr:hypothetical protein [Maribellus sediminis]
MKIKYSIIALLLVLIFSSCKKQEVQYTQVCVLIDVTDEKFRDDNFVTENLPKFLKLMKLDQASDGFSGGEIKLSLINEVSDSKSKTIKIATAETGMLGENPLNRRDEVQRFSTELKESFTTILENADWGTDASKIYQKVSRELLKMKRNEADRKYLIIYSDMLENSKLFSFYGSNWKQQIEKLAEDPELTLDQLAKNGPALPDLSEFEIFVVVTRNPENDEKTNLSEQLWTSILEQQGATVNFNSTLEL